MGRGWGENGERGERGGGGSSLHEQNGLTKTGYTVRVFLIIGLYQFCTIFQLLMYFTLPVNRRNRQTV